MAICIASCRHDYDIRLIDSFWSGDLVSFFYFHNLKNSLSIVECDLVAIFREYTSERFYYLGSIIRNREYSIVGFALHRDTVNLEPFSTFSRWELAECLAYKVRSSSIFTQEYFFVLDSCGDIASPTTWDDDFLPGTRILLEDLDIIVWSHAILEYGDCCHESCGSGSDDGDSLHSHDYRRYNKYAKQFSKVARLLICI